MLLVTMGLPWAVLPAVVVGVVALGVVVAEPAGAPIEALLLVSGAALVDS